MRVAVAFRVRVMTAMRRDPGDRASFESERAAYSQKVLDPFRGFESTVSEEAVIANADAEAAGDPPHQDGDFERGPTEIEKGQSRADVKRKHEKGDRPVDRSFMRIDRYLVSHFSSSREFT